ncbi:hypothetical protein [Clostridium rectalis]|uniref:hypothetical protein n=1 Tax=Clostridium rectalis TaxID=2040295 RepID=UPI000F637B9E|nr:hypothetical protein [Clostridium rectalis]
MGDTTIPPICLKQTDLKELYSVQTPLFAASYYPNRHLNENFLGYEIFLDVIKDAANCGREKFDTDIELDHYYMALCYLSYAGIEDKKTLMI